MFILYVIIQVPRLGDVMLRTLSQGCHRRVTLARFQERMLSMGHDVLAVGGAMSNPQIVVGIPDQTLALVSQGEVIRKYSVSSALNGAGEKEGSGCTPRGWHCVRAKIGSGSAVGAVFVGRRATGEIYSPELAATHPGRDWILSRILWLGGQEPGRNRFGRVDTMRRFIYIHGCPDDCPIGMPILLNYSIWLWLELGFLSMTRLDTLIFSVRYTDGGCPLRPAVRQVYAMVGPPRGIIST